MNPKFLAIGGSLLGLAIGGAVGYLVSKYRLESKYADLASQEIAQAKAYLGSKYKDNLPGRPTTNIAEALEQVADTPTVDEDTLRRVIKGLKYGDPPAAAPAKSVNKNVFDGTSEDEEADEVEDDREEPKPYLISVATYNAGEKGYEQVNLTYFAVDDVLVDEAETPIDNVDELVGNDNLDKFGHRSRDPNIVYIRNDRISVDYEICRSHGSFAEEVHGIIKPGRRPPRKMPKE